MKKTAFLTITLTTVLWAVIIIGFQSIVTIRLALVPPDLAGIWRNCAGETQTVAACFCPGPVRSLDSRAARR